VAIKNNNHGSASSVAYHLLDARQLQHGSLGLLLMVTLGGYIDKPGKKP